MTKWVLVVIILLSSVLRLTQLATNPPSLTWDEVAWGYNAYSVGMTAKDEFGKFLPVTYIESFGDFKPVVYLYLTVISVKLFGLTEFATRFPSAFFGILTVLLTFFLGKKFFSTSSNATAYGVVSAFLLAISPWHINLSRAAFEANVSTFFIVAGVTSFLSFIVNPDKSFLKKYGLIISAICFVLSMYTFNTARIVSPLLVLLLALSFRKELWERKKEVMIGGVIGFLLLLPTLPFLLSPQASLRFKEVNIFSDIKVIETVNQEIANDNNVWWSKILHNRRFAYGQEYIKHYFDHFNPSFLFIKGDGNPKFSTQDVGQLYLFELPFLILGILLLIRKREGFWWIIPIWLLLSIVPAATARETPHALRIETALPTFQLLIAYGIVSIYQSLAWKKVFLALLGVVILGNVTYYLHGYYIHYPRDYSGEWQYGYKEAIAYTEEVKGNYDAICFTTELGRPYAYVLFYSKYDPAKFASESEVTRDSFGFVTVNKFDKYIFAGNVSEACEEKGKTLQVDLANKVTDKMNVQKEFPLKDGSPGLAAFTLN